MPSVHAILKEYWGYTAFRPLQEEIINTVLSGRDSLAILPTGGGKSICFQVPAMAKEGLCLVVTPLIALMKDQVENLRKKGITAFAIHAGMTRHEVISTLKTAANSNCKFLYVSPERLETNVFKEYLPSLGITLIAVDEAHCISQWGYDFRPSYLKIASVREELPHVPVIALTASATTEVQSDICDRLQFKTSKIFRQSFARPNLSYSVFQVSSKINKITEVLEKVSGTAIVYCRSRKKTREISDLLNMQGIKADFYHAGLTQEERNEKQEAWLKDKTRVIVCTNAFGMGIDKPAVRVVVHADVPECLENYYQEAGRAGRDGNTSYAVLLEAPNELDSIIAAADKKFPPESEIREVYKALMNHLQIPSGTGAGNYYELDAAGFIKEFKLDAPTVLSVLKTLEQEELLYFNENVFIQPKVQVIASRETLLEVEKTKPSMDLVIKTLLRTYEGIVDQPVNINTKFLSNSLRLSDEEMNQQLLALHTYRLIDYTPRKDKPQVYLIQNRVKADDLHINRRLYSERKKKHMERVMAMIRYVQTSDECRSVLIGTYFGDSNITECGVCDNCLQKKRKSVGTADYETISRSIFDKLREQPCSLKELTDSLSPIPDRRLNEVLNYLIAERFVEVNRAGTITLKDTPFPASASQS